MNKNKKKKDISNNITDQPTDFGFPEFLTEKACSNLVPERSNSAVQFLGTRQSKILENQINRHIYESQGRKLPTYLVEEIIRILLYDGCDALLFGLHVSPIEGREAYLDRVQEMEQAHFDLEKGVLYIERDRFFS